MILIVFGLPGTGKTYISKIIEKEFGFFFYDGDTDLTPEMKESIAKQITFTNDMRNIFFNKLLQRVKQLQKKHINIVLAQTFIKEKFRALFLKQFPDARFILVQTNTKLRETRLAHRTNYPLDIEYARTMCINFEKPRITHSVVDNNNDGETETITKLKTIILK